MIEGFIAYLQVVIVAYGAWGVFLATLLEEIIAPLPSPIVSLAAGFFLITSDVAIIEALWRALFLIALPVAIGVVIGSSVVYALGFFGGKPFIEKNKKWLGIEWKNIEDVENRLMQGRGDEVTLFVLRLLPIVPGVAISVFGGIVRYPFKKFIVITFLGSLIRAFVLGLIGWQVGEVYAVYAHRIDQIEKYLLAGALFLLVVYAVFYMMRKWNRKKSQV
jgi:membrane protein DedA with SNARE-associated domain